MSKEGSPKTPNKELTRSELDGNFANLIENPSRKVHFAAQMTSDFLKFIEDVVERETGGDITENYTITVTAKKNDRFEPTPTIIHAQGAGKQYQAVQDAIETLAVFAHLPKGTEQQHSLQIEIPDLGIYFKYSTASESDQSSLEVGNLKNRE